MSNNATANETLFDFISGEISGLDKDNQTQYTEDLNGYLQLVIRKGPGSVPKIWTRKIFWFIDFYFKKFWVFWFFNGARFSPVYDEYTFLHDNGILQTAGAEFF